MRKSDSSSDDDDFFIFSAACIVQAFSNAEGSHGGSVSGTAEGHAMELEDAFPKRARGNGVLGGSSAGGPDRLSSLPDCLLHTIMSFLKARQVVQTCVLSTRWRHLWRSVPCLDIDFDEFNNKKPSSDDSSSSDDDTSDSDNNLKDWEHFTKYKDWEDFEDFSLTLMRRCNIAQLESFRLHIDPIRAPEFGDRVAAGWLRRAMKYYCTPDRAIQQGLSSGSWRLKMLHLSQVLLDNDFLKCVNSVCRSLEDLELDSCGCDIQSITSHSLKTLVLKQCGWHNLSEITSPTLKTLVIDDGGSTSSACVLVIMAPSLAYLHLAVCVVLFRGGVSLKEVPSVAKALIQLRGHKYDYAVSKLCGDQFKLLCSISNSTNLELSDVGTKVLGKESRIEFKNLRNLLLDRCDLSDDFKTLVFFLQSSPILEKLTLRCCEFPKYSSKKKGTSILKKNSSSELRGLDFLCENLKVEIKYDDGCGHGPHLIRLLQRVSVNLSKNNIKLTKVN